ncbi:MAG TPA: nucleoside 2-deoxyribosyltransferase [Patescibacteria group bacterium]|nr:nucleoside 2-deoxyribosyltransferase [Patescibacteria group bacterium]
MDIFFIGAIRGGRAHQPKYADIVALLKKFGTVLSEHIADETISDYGETDLSKEAIHDREMESLKKCDVVVAEVTTPSLGVGYLIAQAVNLKKRVVCLYHGDDTFKLSAMIKGDKNVEVHTYKNMGDIEKIFTNKL